MMAVIFEVQPAPGQQDAYLQAAAALRPLLEQVDGFTESSNLSHIVSQRKCAIGTLAGSAPLDSSGRSPPKSALLDTR